MRINLLLIVIFLALSGCGGDSGPDRVILTGTVSYQGQPIEKGVIRFIPSAGTKGPTSGAVIIDGAYEAKARGGVPVGTQRVEIRANRPTGEPKPKDKQHLDIFPDPQEQYLPKRYNDESELTLEVKAGEKTHNFDLE